MFVHSLKARGFLCSPGECFPRIIAQQALIPLRMLSLEFETLRISLRIVSGQEPLLYHMPSSKQPSPPDNDISFVFKSDNFCLHTPKVKQFGRKKLIYLLNLFAISKRMLIFAP